MGVVLQAGEDDVELHPLRRKQHTQISAITRQDGALLAVSMLTSLEISAPQHTHLNVNVNILLIRLVFCA